MVRLQNLLLRAKLSFLKELVLLQNKEGVNIVADDFMLATAADIVADPSAPDVFVEGIMEGKNGYGRVVSFAKACYCNEKPHKYSRRSKDA